MKIKTFENEKGYIEPVKCLDNDRVIIVSTEKDLSKTFTTNSHDRTIEIKQLLESGEAQYATKVEGKNGIYYTVKDKYGHDKILDI